MKSPSRVWALTASLLLTGSLVACGSDDTDDADAGASTPSATSSSPAAASAAAEKAATVTTAESDLGTILVDDEGMTLYLFTKDTQGSGESTCEGECLVAWPALLGEPKAGSGADETLLGTLTRTDGTTQVSYNGWPLYYWVDDTAPGDTSGQGVQGVWWVLDPAGDAIGAA